jgi:hypothetical protein
MIFALPINPAVSRAEIRGYMEVEITNNEQVLTELFSVNTNH